MIVLRKAQNTQLPAQFVDHVNKTYRTSRYVVSEGDGYFNTLTGEAVLVEDYNKDVDKLITKWFLVPVDFDESTAYYLSNQAIMKSRIQRRSGKNAFTIFTTTACNENCYYCFETNKTNEMMSENVAKDVAEYIFERGSYDSASPVHLYWFGGEPLLNPDAITTVCKRLKERRVNYVSQITTNGSKFSDIEDTTLKDVWHLKNVQMSFEGVDDVYEKAKGLPTGKFAAIEETVKRLTNLGIIVSVRLNLDPDVGIEPLKRVVDRFENYKYLLFKPALLYQKRTEDGYKQLFDIFEYAESKGKWKFSLPGIRQRGCLVDGPNRCCIDVKGNILPCTHTDETYASIYDGKDISLNRGVIDKWRTQQKDLKESCKYCVLYPSCKKLEHCEAVSNCNPPSVAHKVKLIKRALKEVTKSVTANGIA